MSRRSFLTSLGIESALLAAGSSCILVGYSEEEGAAQSNPQNRGAVPTGCNGDAPSFRPIEPFDVHALVLSEGFKYEIIHSSEDSLGDDRVYGNGNNHVAYFPMDAFESRDQKG